MGRRFLNMNGETARRGIVTIATSMYGLEGRLGLRREVDGGNGAWKIRDRAVVPNGLGERSADVELLLGQAALVAT